MYDGLEKDLIVVAKFPAIEKERSRSFYLSAFIRGIVSNWSKEEYSPATPEQLAKSVELWVDAIFAHFDIIKALKPDTVIPL